MRITSLFLVSVATLAESAVAEDMNLQRLEQGYLQNRGLFNSFECRFRVIEGHAPNVSAAIKGQVRDPLTKTGTWIVSDRGVRYELICDVEPKISEPLLARKPGQPAFTRVNCAHEIYLIDKQNDRSVSHGQSLNVVNLGRKESVGLVTTPISMGVMASLERLSPARNIQLARSAENVTTRYLGEKLFEGRKLVGFEVVTRLSTETAKRQWWLDPGRGFLPVRAVFFDPQGRFKGTTYATKIKKYPNGGFICERAVQTWIRKDRVNAIIIELVDLDLKTPSPDKLALHLPKGVKVIHEKDGRSKFRLPANEKVSPDNMDSLFTRAEAAIKERLRPDKNRIPGK